MWFRQAPTRVFGGLGGSGSGCFLHEGGDKGGARAGRGRRPLTLPPTKTPLLRPYPLLERLVGPKGGPLRQSVMLSGNIVNIVRGPGILVLYHRYGLPFYRSMLWH